MGLGEGRLVTGVRLRGRTGGALDRARAALLARRDRPDGGDETLPDRDIRDEVATASAARSPVPRLPEIAFEDRISTVEFRVHPDAHIVVDGDACRGCTTRACVTACPANLFVPTADGGILFNYEQCFECGTCYMVCNTEGAIRWNYPEGGHGVVFRRA